MKILRWILVFLLASLCVLAGVVGYFVTSRSALPDFSATNAGVTSVDKSKVKMIFLGTSSMLWTDGKTNWMLDGFFSRQPVLDVMLKKILAAGLALLATSTFAADWPTAKPIRLISVFPPGGSVDQVARVLAPFLQERLKQTVLVENIAGASGLIGTAALAKADEIMARKPMASSDECTVSVMSLASKM